MEFQNILRSAPISSTTLGISDLKGLWLTRRLEPFQQKDEDCRNGFTGNFPMSCNVSLLSSGRWHSWSCRRSHQLCRSDVTPDSRGTS